MRNYDVWLKYKDNDGNPLHGCVMFNVKDGNTPAPIYDSDGTALDNPILTDEYGRTEHQVFVDSDVVAYFYKYVGEGTYNTQTDIDVSDLTKWALQYTAESMDDVTMHITGDAAMCVGTMEELRALDPDDVPEISGKKVITLLGYNSLGDKEPINYVWNPSTSTAGDNGGSIIKNNDLITGRWIMVTPTEHCDSRHFGIFPSNSQSNLEDSSAKIVTWLSYCNRARCKPYFSSNGDYRFYKYTNITVTSKVFDVAANVVFLDYGTSSFTGEWNGTPSFRNHNTNLVCENPKVSWGANVLTGYKVVDIDDEDDLLTLAFTGAEIHVNDNISTKQITFQDCIVYLNKSINTTCTFNRCSIVGERKITASCLFFGCELDQNLFYGSPVAHVDPYCTIPLDQFKDKQLMWLRMKAEQNAVNYDWQGLLTTQSPWLNEVDADRWLINYKGGSSDPIVESSNAHTYSFENCSGSIKLDGKAANSYTFKNCELAVTFDTGYNQNCRINAISSTLNFSQSDIKVASFSLRDSTLAGTGDFDTPAFYAYNSIINENVRCGTCDVKDCNISKTLNIYGVNGESYSFTEIVNGSEVPYTVTRFIYGNIINNFISGQIEIGTIDAHDPHLALIDLVRGLNIIDNVGLSVDPIVVHRSITSVYDEQNYYTYRGNTGTMKWQTDIVGTIATFQYTNAPGILTEMNSGGTSIVGATCNSENNYFAEIQLFTIGTMNVIKRILVEALGSDNSKLNQIHPAGAFQSAAINTVTTFPSTEGDMPADLKKSQSGQFSWYLRNFIIGLGNYNNGAHLNIRISQVD